jgi:hypothetical protein
VFVRHGLSLLWVTAVAVVLQTIFNTEVMRYTLATGEPVFTGFIYYIGVGAFLACVAVLSVGRRIERTLELLNCVLIVASLHLLYINTRLLPLHVRPPCGGARLWLRCHFSTGSS